jgi:hypothetical protein
MVIAIKVTNDIKLSDKHPADTIYNNLNTTIKALDQTSEIWKQISAYVTNTHASTHMYKTKLLDIYEVDRVNERKAYESYSKDIGNKTLLWHGSRVTNYCSILQKGFYLNPESLGVFITGKMFGGSSVYFADAFSKSFNYCGSESSNDIACLLLCEVALGKSSKRTEADYYITKKSLEKEGCQSTWGVGRSTPSSGIIIDDVFIPNGKLISSNVQKATLLYNEYIVYDLGQINIKYMVIVKKI